MMNSVLKKVVIQSLNAVCHDLIRLLEDLEITNIWDVLDDTVWLWGDFLSQRESLDERSKMRKYGVPVYRLLKVFAEHSGEPSDERQSTHLRERQVGDDLLGQWRENILDGRHVGCRH
jgi:hypothetical protein